MIEKLNIEEFNEFIKNSLQGTFFQSSYWGELKSITEWENHIVGIKENNEIKGASLLLSKKIPVLNRYIFYAPRGFILDYNDTEFLTLFVEEIKKYVKKNKGIFIKINPYVEYQERDINGNIVEDGYNNEKIINDLINLGFIHNGFTTTYGKDLEPRWISVLDLENENEESILTNMRSTTRWAINNSYKHGLKLVEIDDTRLEEFKKLMEHTGERRGFIDRTIEYYRQMYKVFKDNIKIMLVEIDVDEYITNLTNQRQQNLLSQAEAKSKPDSAKAKRMLKELQTQLETLEKRLNDLNILRKEQGSNLVIAGGLFMTFGKQVVSLFGASYKEYMKYNGQYFLNFKMIKYALNNGYDKYNFYGITGEFNEDSESYGLFDFKRGFGAKVVELIGEFTLITRPLANKIYNLMFAIYRKLKRIRGNKK